jgi:uncharacterized protein (DUF362 family)
MSSFVAVTKGERGHEPVFKALDLINYKSALADWDKVLIKVNFITDKMWDTGATTDPVVVEAIIQKLKELPVKVYVVESDATMTSADRAFEKTGMKDMCERNGVECLNLRYVEDKVELAVPAGEVLKSITVPRIVTESAVIISKVVVDINTVLKPALTVIDGFVGMEGSGPVDGTPVKMNLIIAGTDTVATDATACRVMGIDPHEIKHIRGAYEKGLGNIDDVQVIGEKLDAVTRPFKRP